jgi:hypothetical protein
MEGTTDFGDHIARPVTKHTNRVFHNPTSFHTTVHMFNPDASSRQCLVKCLLFIRERTSTWFLEWCRATHARQRKGQKTEIL